MWSASEELPTPARPHPLPAGRLGLARPAPTRGANRLWNRGIARERAPRAREGKPPGFPGEGLGAWRRARGAWGGGGRSGVSEGLERVLSKTGPRTKRNPRCELADRRRLLPLPSQAVSPQDSSCERPECPSERRGARVARGHGLTPARGRTRPHARGREGRATSGLGTRSRGREPACLTPDATLGRRWWLRGEVPPSLKTVKGLSTLRTN